MMKKIYSVLAISGLFCFATPSFAAAAAATLPTTNAVAASIDNNQAVTLEVANAAEADWKKLSAKEKREKRKAIKQAVKTAKKNGSDTDLILLVILAILLPPLAMALYDGISTRFWISLLLTLLFFIPGMIYTLVVILGGN